MKKTMFTLMFAILLSGLSYTTSEAREKAKIRIKIATIAPRKSSMMNIIEEFRDEVRKATNNEVDFKVYSGGVQGDEPDVIRKIRLKQLHGGFFTSSGLGRIVPSVRVMDIPFMFRNSDEVLYVLGKLEDTMNTYFEDRGFVVLGWHDIGMVYIFSKEPITSVEELRKQKCWVWGDDPLITEAFKAIGVSPIPLALTDVLTSLSSNLIDNAGSTPFGAVAFRWYTKFRYMTNVPAGNVVGAGIVTREIWDKISYENQAKIKEIAKVYFDRLTEASIEADNKSIKILKNAGIKIIPFLDSESDRKYFMKMGEEARESVIGKLYSRELLNHTLALVDDYRKNHPDSIFIRIK